MGEIYFKQGKFSASDNILLNSIEIRQNLNDANGPEMIRTIELQANIHKEHTRI